MLAMTRQTPPQSVQLAELVSALSYALDLTEGQPAGHNLRACWIGVQIGHQLGLGPQRRCPISITPFYSRTSAAPPTPRASASST